nr:MAG TPA: Rad52/22 family double-strand break repair protein [Bacteriophage sp.]
MGLNVNEIPLLGAEDIECRVQSIKKRSDGGIGAILLLYKNARVDMRMLDQVFGAGNWQRTHEVINGNLFCNLEVWDSEKKVWVRKQDVGIESNTEKEKGQASDAFKRAGFNWGIGRELYTAPFVYVTLHNGEYHADPNGAVRCSYGTRFHVKHIAYGERREIKELQIADAKGNIRYDMNKKVPDLDLEQPVQAKIQQAAIPEYEPYKYTPQEQQKAQSQGAVCQACGGSITEAEYKYSMANFRRALCRTCQREAVQRR